MRQDNDVARMAAALRTPSLRYRSFGNDPVRQDAPREPALPAEFPLLGEALAGIEALPPDVRMSPPEALPPEPVYTPPPPPEPVQVAPPPTPIQVAPSPGPVLPSVAPPVVSSRPEPPPPVVPVARATPTAPATPPMPSLLQTLMAQPPMSPAELPPLVVGRYPPQDPVPAPMPPPATVPTAPRMDPPVPSSAKGPILAPPGWTRAPEPILPSAPPVFPAGGFAAPPMPHPPEEPRPPVAPRPMGSGSGSSLLDTLIGVAASPATASQYPLLDALKVAMKTDGGDPATRLWPAARVEMALPELLRRVAAGVRASRGAA